MKPPMASAGSEIGGGGGVERPVTIAFDSGHLQERGTEVALWDYAHFAETLLGCRSRVLCPAAAPIDCIDRFRSRFGVSLYRDEADLGAALSDVDVYYRIVHGGVEAQRVIRPAGRAGQPGRAVFHAVFTADAPRGDVYAAISPWVANWRSGTSGDGHGGSVDYVPHIVTLPDVAGDLRDELSIPRDAVVLGRHGGADTFNLPFVHQAVARAVQQRDELWFVFLNTAKFCEPHPRIIHLNRTTDMERKARFIQTCDGMLHGRADGETFGLAVGEFAIKNRPVITWTGAKTPGHDGQHIDILREKGIYYETQGDLEPLLQGFGPLSGEFDVYSGQFGPAPVMERFRRVFLSGLPVAAATGLESLSAV